MKPPKSDLDRAAEVLDEYADLLRESFTLANGSWPDERDPDAARAHREHDEFKALANRLRKGVG